MIRPYVLSIAGFDPSGGAGIMSDAKTLEANKVLGLGVVSAITFQHESKFAGISWVQETAMVQQLEVLFEAYDIRHVKIGLIENLSVLMNLVDYLLEKNRTIKIVWDPVMKASAGFVIHASVHRDLLESVCKKIYMITPNWEEMQFFYPEEEPLKAAGKLSEFCLVYLKGGHHEKHKGKDFLLKGVKQFSFNPKRISMYDKHGTGCVFSSAFTANIARGFPLQKALLRAKHYVSYYLLSNKGLLGYHK